MSIKSEPEELVNAFSYVRSLPAYAAGYAAAKADCHNAAFDAFGTADPAGKATAFKICMAIFSLPLPRGE